MSDPVASGGASVGTDTGTETSLLQQILATLNALAITLSQGSGTTLTSQAGQTATDQIAAQEAAASQAAGQMQLQKLATDIADVNSKVTSAQAQLAQGETDSGMSIRGQAVFNPALDMLHNGAARDRIGAMAETALSNMINQANMVNA